MKRVPGHLRLVAVLLTCMSVVAACGASDSTSELSSVTAIGSTTSVSTPDASPAPGSAAADPSVSAGPTPSPSGADASAAATCGSAVPGSADPISFPIAVDPSQRFLVDSAGRPLLLQGDSSWALVAELDHAEVDEYLADRRARGYNTLLVNLLEHTFATNAPSNAAGDPPFTTPGDFSTPNEAYFANADWVLQRAKEAGFVVLLTPAYVGFRGSDEGWYEDMVANGPDKLREYGRYLGRRYGGFGNIVWVNAGDDTPPRTDLVDAVAQGIADEAPGALQTAHTARGHVASDDWGGFSWFNVDNVYGAPNDIAALSRHARAATARPFLLIEGRYENEFDVTTRELRGQAYDSLLAGAMGQIFGNNPIWYFDGVGLYSAPVSWRQALGSAGSTSMTHVGTVLHSVEWWKLLPDVDNAVISGANAVAAVACDGSAAVAYLPSGGTVNVKLDARSGTTYEWFDPSSGSSSPASASTAGGVATLSSPGANAGGDSDWVLVVRGATAVPDDVSPPPGSGPTGGGTPSGLQYHPLSDPVRLLDTRAGFSAIVQTNTPLAADTPLALPGRFTSGTASTMDARALVGNLTVDNRVGAPPGYAAVFPTGTAAPVASNLNFVPGIVRPNQFTVVLGSDGRFNLYSNSPSNFVIDIVGYYSTPSSDGLYYHALPQPTRLLDTRRGATALVHPNAPLTPGGTLSIDGRFGGATGVPPTARAVAGTVTVDNSVGAPPGFAVVYAGHAARPPTSTLNFVGGTIAANAFVVGLDVDGTFSLHSNTGSDFVIDVTGYFDTNPSGGLLFTPLPHPIRELDTRAGATAALHPGSPVTADGSLDLPGTFAFDGITIPSSAVALSGNATSDNSAGAPAGFVALFPAGGARPLSSTLNQDVGATVAAAFTVTLGTGKGYTLYSQSGGHYVIDVNGYYESSAA